MRANTVEQLKLLQYLEKQFDVDCVEFEFYKNGYIKGDINIQIDGILNSDILDGYDEKYNIIFTSNSMGKVDKSITGTKNIIILQDI